MDRRALLTHLGGLLATVLGGPGWVGAAAAAPGGGAAAWLGDLDRRATAARQLTLPPVLQATMAERRLRPGLFGDAFAALTSVTAWRELPPELQQDPQVQARLHQDGRVLGDAVLTLTTYLESLDPEERRRSGDALREDPGLTALLQEGVHAEGLRQGAEPRRLAQLTRVLERTTWRLSRQGADLVIDECVGTVDRVAQRVGLDRHAARTPAPDWSPVGRGGATDSVVAPEDRDENRRITGDIIKHSGQILALFGLMVGGVSAGGLVILSTSTFVFGLTVAALILVAALIMILIGSVVNNP